MPDNKNYNVIYGFGYSKFIHKSDEIDQELEVFVPKEDSVKIQILKLKNMALNKKKIKSFILYEASFRRRRGKNKWIYRLAI